MVYYPRRKAVGLLGFVCLAASIVLTYRYLVTSKISYAIFDVVPIGLSIFLLMPFFRNQVVEVVGRTIVVHTFGSKSILAVENLDSICRSKDGATSYRFSKGGRQYQVTPDVYTDSEAMLKEFARIFNAGNKKRPQ